MDKHGHCITAQKKKWNLVLRGIPGNTKELPPNTQFAVRGFFKNTPAHIADAMLFQAIHRLTNGAEEKRNIIVRFVSLQDRDKVLSLGFKNKHGSSFAVVPDLPPTYYGTNCLGRGGVSLRASEGGLN
ncbi:hypothetical protein KP79_PYT24938 [Mizuhopecten yessoensis]|uniref:Uncharacterized protein n=1 Tax=Mizuhopecten yessoensis TaxID=6573 RepID=A0A210Q2T0_MIZYE|nr:hypothetical protein KP79_PYT24938 [Mizuhopecten yessoensis]